MQNITNIDKLKTSWKRAAGVMIILGKGTGYIIGHPSKFVTQDDEHQSIGVTIQI